ncbi:MAG: DUF1778 domain-containing protein [Burkholderia sp.]
MVPAWGDALAALGSNVGLTSEDFAAFAAMLDAPQAANPGLDRLMEVKAMLIKCLHS